MRTRHTRVTALALALIAAFVLGVTSGCSSPAPTAHPPLGPVRVGALEVSATVVPGALIGEHDPRALSPIGARIGVGESPYTLVVTAFNSSESTVVVPVNRNLPGLFDADGRALHSTGSVSLTSVGTTSQPYIKDFALPPGARLLAIQTFSLLADPVGYTVNWRLGDVGGALLTAR